MSVDYYGIESDKKQRLWRQNQHYSHSKCEHNRQKIPGIEFEFVHRLRLSKLVERITVNFMGFFGALPGLKTAVSLAQLQESCQLRFATH